MMMQSSWCAQLKGQHLQGPVKQDRFEQGTVCGFAWRLAGQAGGGM